MKKRKESVVSLKFVWGLRLKLYAEGNKPRAEGDKLCAEGNKLRAEGNKLCAEGNKLWAEGNKLWAEAILECHGNIKVEWKEWDYCVLETGEKFKA